jgi:hypothetical protein
MELLVWFRSVPQQPSNKDYDHPQQDEHGHCGIGMEREASFDQGHAGILSPPLNPRVLGQRSAFLGRRD